jgi:hypothetical protein
MNTYHAFHKSKKIEVEAETSLAAQKLAAGIFKARKTWEVDIYLVALAGAAVANNPSILPGA